MFNTVLAAAQEQSNTGTSVFELIWEIAAIAGLWKMFEKAGEDGWKAIIPFYSTYKLCEKVMNDGLYFLRIFWFIVPVVGWILGFMYLYRIGKATALAYGKPLYWAWGYTFLSPIFYCITGFDDSEYYGPFGSGDSRTSNARGAKTVDFEVVKNEPQQTYQDYSSQTRYDAAEKANTHSTETEEDVEFVFDEPTE